MAKRRRRPARKSVSRLKTGGDNPDNPQWVHIPMDVWREMQAAEDALRARVVEAEGEADRLRSELNQAQHLVEAADDIWAERCALKKEVEVLQGAVKKLRRKAGKHKMRAEEYYES